MTTPYERAQAVIRTREFLEDLASGRLKAKDLPIRARSLLWHYPDAYDLEHAERLMAYSGLFEPNLSTTP